jgi:hypothetical protein
VRQGPDDEARGEHGRARDVDVEAQPPDHRPVPFGGIRWQQGERWAGGVGPADLPALPENRAPPQRGASHRSGVGAQRSQETLAPLDSTRAARLAMARKILFDMCTPPSSCHRADVLAVGLAAWFASLDGHHPEATVTRRTGLGVPSPSCLVCSVVPEGLRSTSPAHRSLCSFQWSPGGSRRSRPVGDDESTSALIRPIRV